MTQILLESSIVTCKTFLNVGRVMHLASGETRHGEVLFKR